MENLKAILTEKEGKRWHELSHREKMVLRSSASIMKNTLSNTSCSVMFGKKYFINCDVTDENVKDYACVINDEELIYAVPKPNSKIMSISISLSRQTEEMLVRAYCPACFDQYDCEYANGYMRMPKGVGGLGLCPRLEDNSDPKKTAETY